jgi:hypothetical protein
MMSAVRFIAISVMLLISSVFAEPMATWTKFNQLPACAVSSSSCWGDNYTNLTFVYSKTASRKPLALAYKIKTTVRSRRWIAIAKVPTMPSTSQIVLNSVLPAMANHTREHWKTSSQELCATSQPQPPVTSPTLSRDRMELLRRP